MKKEQFENIKICWEKLIKDAHEKYDTVLSQDDLLNMPVKDLSSLVEYSREFVSTMGQLFCDFRHILGMGNLKANEQSKLVSIFKEINTFRSDAKRITSISTIDRISYIPSRSKYTLKLNPDITLLSELRPGQDDIRQIDDETLEEMNQNHETDQPIKNNIFEILKEPRNVVKVRFTYNNILRFRKLFNDASNIILDPEKI